MSIGLVFSGGGVRGSAHIGVLKALHENYIKPRMIAGTSAGSIVAGLYSYGYNPEEIRLLANRISRNYYDVDYQGILSSLFGVVFNNDISLSGLIKGRILESYFHRVTKGALLNSAKIPTAISAVDINNGKLVIFTSMPFRFRLQDDTVYINDATFADAIRSSISIPGIFKPKMFKNMRLVDGGLRSNLPVELVRQMGARKVIAVNLGYSGYPVPGVDNIIEISLQSIDLMIYQINRPNMDQADIIITPLIDNVKHSDISKIDYIAECGYRATIQAMPRIKKILAY